MPEPFIIAADAVISMDPAYPRVMSNAGIVVENDKIAAVGELSDLRQKYGALQIQTHKGILLPGLVNAHTHLELSYQSAEARRAESFPRWVAGLIRSYPPAEQLEAAVRAATRIGVADSLRAGVTTLGDISRHAAITRGEIAAIAPAPRVTSFAEVVGLGKMRDRAAALIDASPQLPEGAPETLRAGISPHAPYTVEGPVLRACLRKAIIKNMPICMHLAELVEESTFLHDLSGPLGREWDLMLKMDILDDNIPLMQGGGGGPIRWAQRWGLLRADAGDPRPRTFPVLLAHVNYCDDGELSQLAVSRASVVYCPRTHAYFNHPPHRYRDMLEAGINVSLGTDSLASNPDLSVLREAQFLHKRDQVDPYMLLEMITIRAARALGMDPYVGTLSPGKYADMILLPLVDGDPIQSIIASALTPAATWIAGKLVQ